jgi:hypothetical protein
LAQLRSDIRFPFLYALALKGKSIAVMCESLGGVEASGSIVFRKQSEASGTGARNVEMVALP